MGLQFLLPFILNFSSRLTSTRYLVEISFFKKKKKKNSERHILVILRLSKTNSNIIDELSVVI